MSELRSYQFPAPTTSGLMLGLSAPRLVAVGLAGVTFVLAMAVQTAAALLLAAISIVALLAAVFVRVGGRPAIDWVPVWVAFGWAAATRNNEFYASPDLSVDLPPETLDLPGELFGLELHSLAPSPAVSVANATPAEYGVVVDTFRHRLVAVAEVSGEDFLFLDPCDEQARVSAWGATLDHIAQSMPELCRVQVVHTAGPSSVEGLVGYHDGHGGRGPEAAAQSYRHVLARSGAASQEHRLLVAIALDARAARRAVRQAGGGTVGAGKVLMDRAAAVEEALSGCGLEVHGWLPARAIAQVLRVGFDPAARVALAEQSDDVNAGGGVEPSAAGPYGMVDQWSMLRHDSGWSTTLQVVGPPTRPVTGDFLQHLLIGVPAQRRMSLLYVPTPMEVAERRAQTQQVGAEAEQAVRARWGFATTARHRREHGDAAKREQDLVEGRAVYRVVWLITVTAASPAELDASVGQLEAAGRRCGLELRRMAGTQRQAAGFTLPLCRGAR
ncbi:SCO6880 family protein [Nitriliruptor alkaliphilus]|uniref:SCO6880 family protein n=1 Tax=Nitriliruptor alkaliphilus TaxID=427918 RepID=UPI000697AE88|nr:SCO6880 family protein [Nitriliruptor alkaliphilus]